jgi:hypothetical protein
VENLKLAEKIQPVVVENQGSGGKFHVMTSF